MFAHQTFMAAGGFSSGADIIGLVCTNTAVLGGAWAYVDRYGNAFTPPSGYFDSHAVWGGVEDITIDGQSMVKFPKFYCRHATLSTGPYSGKVGWWISDKPYDGFHIHPAFMSYGNEIDQCYVGKYQASDDGTKLKSVAGVYPTVNKTISQARTMAYARNTGGITGFKLWSIYHLGAIQWMYLIENSSMHCQATTGAGYTNTSNLSIAHVDYSLVAEATYRGVVGLWGNVNQWVDGLKTTRPYIYLWDNTGHQTWVNTGHIRGANGEFIWPSTFMSYTGASFDFSDVFIGQVGGTALACTCADDQYFDVFTSEQFGDTKYPHVGGSYSSGIHAGLWYLSCFYGYTVGYNGARLAKI